MQTPIIDGTLDTASSDGQDLIKDASTETFVADVIEASQTTPVIVDFWAPWCGPCKQLTPILEQTVREAKGAVRMVKVNIDENQVLASQIGVQSIPAVFAFANGRPVDAFMGAVPASQVKDFIGKLIPEGEPQGDDSEIEAARTALAAGNVEAAAQIFASLLQQDASNIDALVGLATCYAAIGEYERAEQALETVPPEQADTPEIAALRTKIDLAKDAPDAGQLTDLEARVSANAGDHQARYDLARAYNASGERDKAIDELISIMERQRDWQDDAARRLLLQFFEAWGPQNSATVAGRQKLSLLLFA